MAARKKTAKKKTAKKKTAKKKTAKKKTAKKKTAKKKTAKKKTAKRKAAKKKTAKKKGSSEAPRNRRSLEIIRHAMTPFVDANGKALHYNRFRPVQNACEVCPARCCHLTVHVNLYDAVRFCTALGLGFFHAFTFVAGDESERCFDLDGSGDERATVGARRVCRAHMALKRSEKGACHYLLNIDGHLRCGVYGVRPGNCRMYPLSWRADNMKGGPHVVMCPVPYAVDPKMAEGWIEDAADALGDWDAQEAIVNAWQKRPEGSAKDIDTWLEFALTRAGRQLGVDVSGMFDQRGMEQRLRDAQIESGIIP